MDRARVRLHDERLDQVVAPLPAKRGTAPVFSAVLLSESAPERFRDRGTLWNAVEAGERRHDAGVAREVEFALPCELTREQSVALAVAYVLRAAFVADSMMRT